MKNSIAFLIFFIACWANTSIHAQITAFNGTSFSFVAKDGNGQLLTNQSNLSLVATLHANSATGTTLYAENHTINIPNDGVVSGVLGQGTPTSGTFSAVDWSAQDVFLVLELNGINQGAMQFFSVPYAQVAKNVSDKNVVVVTQANHTAIALNDNDIVKVDEIINIGANTINTFTSPTSLSVMGGGFEGTSSSASQVTFNNQSTVTSATFKNVSVSGSVFINCIFENVIITSNTQFINCTFIGSTLQLGSNCSISGGFVGGNTTVLNINFGSNCKINNAIISGVITNLIDGLSLTGNRIVGSRFNRVQHVSSNTTNNCEFHVEHVFSSNQCIKTYVRFANISSPYAGYPHDIVISGNHFDSDITISPLSHIIEVECFDVNNVPQVIIANNTFQQLFGNAPGLIKITGNRGGSGSSAFMHIMIDNNIFFTQGPKIIDYTASGTIRTLIRNNVSTNNSAVQWGNPLGTAHIFTGNYKL